MANKVEGWTYYNHALIPTCPPHMKPDLSVLKSKEIWKKENWNGNKPLLIRWTDNFDCDRQTKWWYCIRDGEYSLEELSKSSKKNILRGLKKCSIRIIDSKANLEELFEVYEAAFSKYEDYDNRMTKSEFEKYILNLDNSTFVWGGYSNDNGKLIGWMTVKEFECYCDIMTAKFHPMYLNARVSDAMYSTVLDYYLNIKKKKYINSGTRSINHNTNTQEYKEIHFNYRKAYCDLHIIYSKKIKWIITILYPFRKIIFKMKKVKILHHLSSLLLMEQIKRGV